MNQCRPIVNDGAYPTKGTERCGGELKDAVPVFEADVLPMQATASVYERTCDPRSHVEGAFGVFAGKYTMTLLSIQPLPQN